jgi:hypothetical protein
MPRATAEVKLDTPTARTKHPRRLTFPLNGIRLW